jgi:hypothetical protein
MKISHNAKLISFIILFWLIIGICRVWEDVDTITTQKKKIIDSYMEGVKSVHKDGFQVGDQVVLIPFNKVGTITKLDYKPTVGITGHHSYFTMEYTIVIPDKVANITIRVPSNYDLGLVQSK